jgi:hypothetical protein
MKAYWGVEVSSAHSLTSALDGGEQLHAPAALPPGNSNTFICWILRLFIDTISSVEDVLSDMRLKHT